MSEPTRYSANDPYYAARMATIVTRPGLVTAIGIFSIIVGSLGLLGSIGTGTMGIKIYRLRQSAVDRAKNPIYRNPPAPTVGLSLNTPPATTPPAPNAEGDSMELPDRQVFEGVVTQLEFFSEDRLKQFDAILSSHGWKIFPLRNQTLSTKSITRAITAHGTFPSNSPKDPEPVYITTAAGRLEVYLDRTVFRPSDGSPVIRNNLANNQSIPNTVSQSATDVAAAPDSSVPQGQAAMPGAIGQFGMPGVKLTTADIELAVLKAQQAAGNKLNPAQLKAIRVALADPNQVLMQPGAFSPVSLAIVQPDGTAIVKFQQAYVVIDSSGNLTLEGGTSLQAVAVRPLALSGLLSESLLAFVLAAALIFAGVLTLKRVRLGYVLHIVYAVAKIPVAVAGGLALAWVISGCEASTVTGGTGDSGQGAVWGSIVAGLGIIYPFILLLVLFTRGVRDYFRTEG